MDRLVKYYQVSNNKLTIKLPLEARHNIGCATTQAWAEEKAMVVDGCSPMDDHPPPKSLLYGRSWVQFPSRGEAGLSLNYSSYLHEVAQRLRRDGMVMKVADSCGGRNSLKGDVSPAGFVLWSQY
ncbi:unnamed protein product [Cuscuta europaea]|uniref:Uncharacterized protein n=1 Tax=Cuscuta europaea TaxID=41803 RepID=A0A9P1EFG0_CUSEU|nr:unnamed protein product [Cuscuta europaea]